MKKSHHTDILFNQLILIFYLLHSCQNYKIFLFHQLKPRSFNMFFRFFPNIHKAGRQKNTPILKKSLKIKGKYTESFFMERKGKEASIFSTKLSL